MRGVLLARRDTIKHHGGAASPFTVTAYKNGNGSSSTNNVVVSGITTAGGETLLVFASTNTTTFAATPVTDSASSTYASVYSVASTTGTVARQLCYSLVNAGAGITSVTVTKSATDTKPFSVIVVKVVGAITASSVDINKAAGASSGSTSLASGTSAGSIGHITEAVFGCGSSSNNSVAATFSAQAFGGTAASYSGQTDLGVQSDGASTTWQSMDVYWANLSGGTLGTISFAETCSQSSGWVCGVVSVRSA